MQHKIIKKLLKKNVLKNIQTEKVKINQANYHKNYRGIILNQAFKLF